MVKITDHEKISIKNLALENLDRQKMLKEYTALHLVE